MYTPDETAASEIMYELKSENKGTVLPKKLNDTI
jgi:hypothetical protein